MKTFVCKVCELEAIFPGPDPNIQALRANWQWTVEGWRCPSHRLTVKQETPMEFKRRK